MIPTAIAPGRNPGGLVSIVYDDAGHVVRSSNLTFDDPDVETAAELDADAVLAGLDAGHPHIAVIYDGDTGHQVIRLGIE